MRASGRLLATMTVTTGSPVQCSPRNREPGARPRHVGVAAVGVEYLLLASPQCGFDAGIKWLCASSWAALLLLLAGAGRLVVG
jgi:hypothetical protein